MAESENQPIPYTYEFVVDEPYQTALTRGLYAQAFRTPAVWVMLLVFLLLFLGLAVLNQQWWLPILWVVLMVGIYGLRYVRTRGAMRRAFPVGKVMRTGFGPTHFAISDGADASVVAYSGYDEIETRGALVWMRRLNPRRRVAYPRALFPDAEIARMRAGAVAPQPPIAGPGPLS